MENLVSNAERRAIMTGETVVVPRMCDLPHVLPGLTGKVELVFEGEQEGAVKVGKALVGKGGAGDLPPVFPGSAAQTTPAPGGPCNGAASERAPRNTRGSSNGSKRGNAVEVSDSMPLGAYAQELSRVPGLRDLVKRHIPALTAEHEIAAVMEFVLDGLHQNSKIAQGRSGPQDLVQGHRGEHPPVWEDRPRRTEA